MTSGSPPAQTTAPDMSDLESDGPQKSHSTPRDNRPPPSAEFDEGDDAQLAVDIGNRRTSLNVKILEGRVTKGLWEYKVECEGQPYTQTLADGTLKEWFPERDLEAV